MKRIFIGSASEALWCANRIATRLSEESDLQPVVWDTVFPAGSLTLEAIDVEARRCVGAVIIATPDDAAEIRGQRCRVPRANVLFEYGYFIGAHHRYRVALCRYEEATLPTDFNGLTHIKMGSYEAGKKSESVGEQKMLQLLTWARALPTLAPEVLASGSHHAYSGVWSLRVVYEVWRGIALDRADECVELIGKTQLLLSTNGFGSGVAFGNLVVIVKGPDGICRARFSLMDDIENVACTSSGGLRIQSRTFNRQRTSLTGRPPQDDGFEEELEGASQFTWMLEPDGRPGTLVGSYEVLRGNSVRSRAHITLVRSPRAAY